MELECSKCSCGGSEYTLQQAKIWRQLRRAKSVLQTMFLDSDLKELAEGGVPIEEVNAMQKQRDEYNKNTFTRV